MVQYSGIQRQRLVFDFDAFSDNQAIIRRLDNLQYIAGTTGTGKALELALKSLMKRQQQRTTHVITVTDGKPELELMYSN